MYKKGVLGFQGRTFFHVFDWECLFTTIMEIRKKSEGDVVVFMDLMFLCCFLLFGMNVMLWILLDVG